MRRLGLGVALLLLPMGCATTAPRSPLLEKVGRSEMSVAEIRVLLRDLARRLPGMLEEATDRLAAHSPSPGLGRRMLELKSNGVPILRAILLKPDPIGALVDGWAFLAQLEQALPRRAPRASPEQLALAEQELRRMEATLEQVWIRISANRNEAAVRERVHRWAEEHPLTGPLSSRPSTAALLASVSTVAQVSPLRAAAGAFEDLRDLNARVDLYASTLPKDARWQGELAALNLLGSPTGGGVAGQVNRSVDQLQRAVDELARLTLLAESTPAFIERERLSVMGALARQQRAFERFGDGQREAVMDDLDRKQGSLERFANRQREAISASVARATRRTFDQVNGMANGWVDHAFDRADTLVRRIFLWLLALVGLCVLGLLAAVALLVRRWPARSAGRG